MIMILGHCRLISDGRCDQNDVVSTMDVWDNAVSIKFQSFCMNNWSADTPLHEMCKTALQTIPKAVRSTYTWIFQDSDI